MRWSANIDGRVAQVELTRKPGGVIEAAVDGRRYSLSVSEPQTGLFSILCDGISHEVVVQPRQGRCRVRIGPWAFDVAPAQPGSADLKSGAAKGDHGGRTTIRAVMPGRVLRVLAQPGQKVVAKQGLVVVEAMKMENEVTAPRDGVVKEMKVAPGRTVEMGEILAIIE